MKILRNLLLHSSLKCFRDIPLKVHHHVLWRWRNFDAFTFCAIVMHHKVLPQQFHCAAVISDALQWQMEINVGDLFINVELKSESNVMCLQWNILETVGQEN